MKKMKKALSLLACICLVLSVMPATAFAEEAHTHSDSDGNGFCDECAQCMGAHSFEYDYYHEAEAGHYRECDYCIYYDPESFGEHSFEYGWYYVTETGHYRACDRCPYYDPESFVEHSYDGDSDYICNDCDYNRCTHEGAQYICIDFDNAEHGLVCGICGEDEEWYPHSDGDGDGLCDGCGYDSATTDADGSCLHKNKDQVCVCVDCGEMVHTYREGYYEIVESHHYDKCVDCSYYENGELHADENSDCACDVCGGPMHEFDELQDLGNGSHQGVCTKCGNSVTEEHRYYGIDYDEQQHWEFCECGAVEPSTTGAHVIENNYYYADSEKHYPRCNDCVYYKDEGEAHDFGADGDCTVCGAKKHVHTYENMLYYSEDGYHYPVCDSCGEYDADLGEACVSANGTTYCDTCGTCVNHSFQHEFYHVEDEYHYLECDNCEYYDESTREAHADGDLDHFCDACDYCMSECVDDEHDHFCDYCGESIPITGTCGVCGMTGAELEAACTGLTYHEDSDRGMAWYSGTLEVTASADGTVTAVWGEDASRVEVTKQVKANEPASLEFDAIGLDCVDSCHLTFQPDAGTNALPAETDLYLDSTLELHVYARTKFIEALNATLNASLTVSSTSGLRPGEQVTVKLNLQQGDTYTIGRYQYPNGGGQFTPVEGGCIYYMADGSQVQAPVADNGNGTITFTLPDPSDGYVYLDIHVGHDTGKCVDEDGDHWCDSELCENRFAGIKVKAFTDADSDGLCDLCGFGGIQTSGGIACELDEALSRGSTAKLLADHTEVYEEDMSVYALAGLYGGSSATVDLNGCTLSAEGAPYLFSVGPESTLKIIDSSAAKTGTMTNPGGAGIISLEGGTLDLSGYPDPAGIVICNNTNAPIAIGGYTGPEPICLLLPAGYALKLAEVPESLLLPAGYNGTVIAVCSHIDENKDHTCDNGCGKTGMGIHADANTDSDHVCDYGCGAVLESCSDKTGDKDHRCDACGAKNVTAHTYGNASPACTECGSIAPLIEELEKEADEMDAEAVKSTDKAELEQFAGDIEELLDMELIGDERAALEAVLEQVEDMIDTIDETAGDSKAAADIVGALDAETVTSDDQKEIEQAVATIDGLLQTDHLTQEERAALTDAKADAEALLDVIETAQDAADTANTEKVGNVTAGNVKPGDQKALEDAKADLEKALKDNSGNYTAQEKQAIQTELQRIENAMAALENVADVTGAVKALPETVNPDDEEATKKILDAKKAYDALTDHEKSLVDETTRKKLDTLVSALTDYKITKGDGGKWTMGSTYGLGFTANGPFSKFAGVEVDGKEVASANYTAEAGSTVVTFKQSFLSQLSTGEHTITVLYTDGEASGTFKVLAQSDAPATGDDTDLMLWSGLLCISTLAAALLLADHKRRSAVK